MTPLGAIQAPARRYGFGLTPTLKARIAVIYGGLAALNGAAWTWAFIAFGGRSALLGIALMAYGLGLRHAVDADHIAAIDNVTRKLIQEGKRPVGVGLFFALGHSIVVAIVAGAVACASTLLGRFQGLRDLGALLGTGVSALFLLAIATMNVLIFASTYRAYRRVRAGGAYQEEDLDAVLAGRGLLARLFRPLFRLVTESWQMLLVGFLFGLGFDTATEIALFGVSATQMAHGASLLAILALPALFAAGMSLVDTTDGVMMLGAYDWAFLKPVRKLYYNMTITLVSVLVAVGIGGLEALGLVGGVLRQRAGGWAAIAALNGDFNQLGFAIIALFAAAWALSFLIYRLKKLDSFEPPPRS